MVCGRTGGPACVPGPPYRLRPRPPDPCAAEAAGQHHRPSGAAPPGAALPLPRPTLRVGLGLRARDPPPTGGCGAAHAAANYTLLQSSTSTADAVTPVGRSAALLAGNDLPVFSPRVGGLSSPGGEVVGTPLWQDPPPKKGSIDGPPKILPRLNPGPRT